MSVSKICYTVAHPSPPNRLSSSSSKHCTEVHHQNEKTRERPVRRCDYIQLSENRRNRSSVSFAGARGPQGSEPSGHIRDVVSVERAASFGAAPALATPCEAQKPCSQSLARPERTVELNGIEPMTSGLQSPRSPS